MKCRGLIGAMLAISLVLPAAARGIGNPVSAGTVPPSHLSSGLIRSPGTVGPGGSLIGGTLGAGGILPGVTPYGRGSYLLNAPPSSALGNVQLHSPLGYLGYYSGAYPPYYSPSAIAGTAIPGSAPVAWPPTTPVTHQAIQGFAISSAGAGRVLVNPHLGVSNTRFRAMRFSTLELESLILDGVSSYAQARKLFNQNNIGQMERLAQDLERLKHRATPLRQSLIVRDESLRPLSALRPPRNIPQPFELPDVKTRPQRLQFDSHLQSEARDDELAEALKDLPGAEQVLQSGPGEEKTDTERLIIGGREKAAASEDSKEKTVLLGQVSGADRTARLKEALGDAGRADVYSQRRFEQYLAEGDGYLLQGRFYWSADAYSLAALYNPSDYRSYAGKSRALFAAGEYISCAMSLARAIAVNTEFVRSKVDFEALVGDKDQLESRIVDLEAWAEKSGAVELRFLLAYVYFHNDRIDKAKEAIEAIGEKATEIPAVKTLKDAIDAGPK